MRTLPEPVLQESYEKWAQEYLRQLPPERLMESVAQALEKLILLAALQVMHLRRPDIQSFSELLIQYDYGIPAIRRGIVPDVFVVLHPTPVQVETYFGVPMQPVGPFLVFECVSNSNKRKDYEESFQKYEQELKVPYYLLFYPDNHELTLYHLRRGRYSTVRPNEHERYEVPEMEMEVAVHEEWLRVWFRGELVGTPAELQQRLDIERQIRLAVEAEHARERQARLAVEAENVRERQARLVVETEHARERQARLTLETEVARLRAEIERLRGG